MDELSSNRIFTSYQISTLLETFLLYLFLTPLLLCSDPIAT